MGQVALAREQMAALEQYLKQTVEPAFEDFKRNPFSARHAYLACVAAYHSIDRASYPRRPGNLRKQWRNRSFEFAVVDMVAHKFKHVISDDEKVPTIPGRIPLHLLVFGRGTLNSYGFNTTQFGDGGIDFHNLHFIIRDAIKFLHQQALEPQSIGE